MAGGRSSRFGSEKLLQLLDDRRIIDITTSNISRSRIGKFFVAVSNNAPLTMEYCKRCNFIRTPGYGYPEDVKFLLDKFREPILLLNGDSIFIDPEIINNFVDKFQGRSMAAAVIDGEYKFIGLNIAVPGDERDLIVVYDNNDLALNINTISDLIEARKRVSK